MLHYLWWTKSDFQSESVLSLNSHPFSPFLSRNLRGGIVKAATIEEIEAEKSSIEKDVVSLSVMVDLKISCSL